jgi:AbrB family looped-hinge helix DNA binding protein
MEMGLAEPFSAWTGEGARLNATREQLRLSEYQIYCKLRYSEDSMESARVGKRGVIVVPARLRKRFGMEEGSLVTAEERDDGILIRPAVLIPVEKYSPERKAEFLLSTATTEADYGKAKKEVRKLGLDPASIPHRRPG